MISNYEPRQHYYYVATVASHSCTASILLSIEWCVPSFGGAIKSR